MKLLMTCLTLICSLYSANIYEEIEQMQFDPAGYFANERALSRIFDENEIHTVIELGCWAGRSTRFLGFNVGEQGKVYAIDNWLGTPGHPGEIGDPRLSYIYQLFLSNIHYMGLDDRVIPLRMDTDEALRALRHVVADMIYIDAPRDSEAVYRDIIHWSQHLKDGGIMCGAEFREPGVRDGVLKAANELGRKVESDRKGLFWRLK